MKKNKKVLAFIVVLLAFITLGVIIIPPVVKFYIGQAIWNKTIKLGTAYSQEITAVSKSISEYYIKNDDVELEVILEQIKSENPEMFSVVFDELGCCIMPHKKQEYDNGDVDLAVVSFDYYTYGYLYFPREIDDYWNWGYRTEKIADGLYAYKYTYPGV